MTMHPIKTVLLLIAWLVCGTVSAQNFDGQWRGTFSETSYGFSGLGSAPIDYVLELDIAGTDVSGYSYTYFNEAGKRYYTICKLTGTLNRSTRDLVVTETERVKFNTPPGFQNCFQTHKLHYDRDSTDEEHLRGTWIPAPNQDGNCGYGTTLLVRKIVHPLTPAPKNEVTAERKSGERRDKKTTTSRKTTPAVAHRTTPGKKVPNKPSRPVAHNPAKTVVPVPSEPDQKELTPPQPTVMPDVKMMDTVVRSNARTFEPRRRDVIRTVPITQAFFTVDFYDNGEIDGDSITVFYNGRIVLDHKMLSDKPITLKLALSDAVRENVLTMYADNLGTIPPNTALMIVHDGDKRYEVRIESDTQKSGSVIFTHGQ